MQDDEQIEAKNDDTPKQAAFRQVNPADNPMDEHGKTKRDYEVEQAQANSAGAESKPDDGGQDDVAEPGAGAAPIGAGTDTPAAATMDEYTGFDGPNDKP